MPAIPTFISLLDRLHAAVHLLNLASKLLPELASETARQTISQQIRALRSEIQQQIDSVERSMQQFQDRLETIAQFVLVNRDKISPDDAREVERLVAAVRGS